jgi:hypothetical protein
MFRELRLQHGLTQSEIATATHRTPNYILKAEDLTFPSPPPALMQFYRELDPALTHDLLTDWYYSAQRTKRELWLEVFTPTAASQPTFRGSWIMKDYGNDWLTPTQYALSKGLCIPASVVYNMERYPKKAMPAAVGVVMDQLLTYTKSGRFNLNENFDPELIDSLERIKEEFSHDR